MFIALFYYQLPSEETKSTLRGNCTISILSDKRKLKDYQFHPQTKKDLLVKLKQKQPNHEPTLRDEKALSNIRSNIPYMSSLSLWGVRPFSKLL